jgi:hypothetical protein
VGESELHDHDDDEDHPEASSSAPTAPAAPLSASALRRGTTGCVLPSPSCGA